MGRLFGHCNGWLKQVPRGLSLVYWLVVMTEKTTRLSNIVPLESAGLRSRFKAVWFACIQHHFLSIMHQSALLFINFNFLEGLFILRERTPAGEGQKDSGTKDLRQAPH